jgi:hypothetical protein
MVEAEQIHAFNIFDANGQPFSIHENSAGNIIKR